MAKFCTNCGNALSEGAAFCDNCGAPVAAPAPQQTQAQWQQPQQVQAQWQQPQQTQAQWQQPQQAQPQWQQPQQAQAQWQQPQQAQPQWQQPQQAQPQWQQPPEGVWIPAAAQQTRTFSPTAAGGWRAAPSGGAQEGVPAPGWSGRVDDPELRAALAKQKRASNRLSGILIPIPLLAFAVYGGVSDSMEFSRSLLYGAIVSAVFLIFSWIGKRQSSGKNAYEGVVTDKQTRTRSRKGDQSSYTEMITVVRTSTGEQKRIVERSNSRTPAWDYLQIGAQFRYHPEHAFPYELYDKSRAPYLCCVVCQKKNPLTADRCQKCGAPLLR